MVYYSNHCIKLVNILPMENSGSLPFEEHCQSFVEPKALPILAGDKVATPRMNHLVNDNVGATLIADYDARWDEG
jgi:hypothetical protein